MASLDLNIIDRGITTQTWSAEKGQITENDLRDVGENRTNNGSALNALPTPFARFHVVNEAFRRVFEERLHKDKGVDAGDAYRQLVSDCLDVFELLYYWNYHKSHSTNDLNIYIKEWKYEDNIGRLENMSPILGKSISNYRNKDIKSDILYFVVLEDNGKEYLLATTSPMTGFATPPDLDRKPYSKKLEFSGSRYNDMPLINRKGKGKYFGETCMFEDRPREFKKYMFELFRSKFVSNDFKHIRDYIGSFDDSDTRKKYHLITKPVLTEDNNKLIVNGLTISESNGTDTLNFFSDYIIKLPYRISADNFLVPQYINDSEDRDYDYIIPLTREALNVLPLDEVNICFKENRKTGSFAKIEVSFEFNEETYKREYRVEDRPTTEYGCIADIKNTWKVNFDMGLFPRTLSAEPNENNYFKLMLAIYDDNENDQINAEKVQLDFFVKRNEDIGCDLIEVADSENYTKGARSQVVRSEQSQGDSCTTLFYEVFNTAFDVIRLQIEEDACGILIPKWTQSQRSTKSYTYAIDFGTSNTYVSRRESNNYSEPQQLTMDKPIMSYLHEKLNNKQIKPIDCWDDAGDPRIVESLLTEFVPPFIDGKKYKFPLRTALCRLSNGTDSPALFDNRNIAFCYEKKRIGGNNRVITDLKWSEVENKKEAEIYIRELLAIIKSDILDDNGDLSQTQIIWFQPLSFKNKMRADYDAIWKRGCEEILCINESQIRCYTESEAPYYYFLEMNKFKSTKAVSIIDIGGGSTDMVYFSEDKPVIANSVHFGCDILWGNGNNSFIDTRENGIYKRYKDIIQFKNDELRAINEDLCKEGSKYTTTDIINFWLGNSGETEIDVKLRSEFKHLFLYHYAAIIYHMASVYKAKDLECPTTITFSGNGSKYIDNLLTKDEDLLVNMTMIILKDIFGDSIRRVQIILPDQRKESTCYGGLYRDKDRVSPSTFQYVGYGKKQYESIDELNADYKPILRKGIVNEVNHLNDLYISMLKMLIKEEKLDEKAEKIRSMLDVNPGDELDKIYIRDIKEDESYNDSLFFIPIIQQVFNLTQKD